MKEIQKVSSEISLKDIYCACVFDIAEGLASVDSSLIPGKQLTYNSRSQTSNNPKSTAYYRKEYSNHELQCCISLLHVTQVAGLT